MIWSALLRRVPVWLLLPALLLNLTVAVGWWTLRRPGWWLLRRPLVLLTAGLAAGVWWVIDRLGFVSVPLLLLPLGVACLFGWLHPAEWDRYVETPVRSRWRRAWVYRRQWPAVCVVTGLAQSGGPLPKLGRVRATAVMDEVRVTMLRGHTLRQWQAASEQLARTFGVRQVRVYADPDRPRQVVLRCLTGDPLEQPVPPLPADDPVDLEAIPVGLREDGSVFTLPLLYSHILIAGETGSGKGSVAWSLVCGVAPAVRAGLVRIWALDGKGGMELAAGEGLFAEFIYDPAEFVDALEDAVAEMRARADRLRGVTRKLTPTVDEPLIVVLVDEAAALVAYESDADVRRRTVAALSLLLSQGRAVGVSVIAATQDPRKEVLSMRDLFPLRVALRTAEAAQADLILGRGAHERGAHTESVSERTPGVGYVVEDGVPEPVRVRFSHITDETIAALVADAEKPPPQRLEGGVAVGADWDGDD